MPLTPRRVKSLRLDERGIALPLALMGLVVVTLLVTAALLSSSTEMATSQARTDGSTGLYQAEAAVDRYLSAVAAGGARLQDSAGVRTYTLADQDPHTTDPRLQFTTTTLSAVTAANGAVTRTFSILSEPMRGNVARGRAVVAMVAQNTPPPMPFNTNVKSAIALGGNLDVNGNAFTVSGRRQSSDTCATRGVDAVQRTTGSEITANNQNHMNNFIGQDTMGNNTSGWNSIRTIADKTRQQLAYEALGLTAGQTLDDLINSLPDNKKFGPEFGTPTSAFDGRVDYLDKVAVVDANGGTVDLLGDSGVVIIKNGHVRMRGSTVFKGIIIVEGNFDLAGTPTVNGALISLGIQETAAGNIINLDSDAVLAGHVTVQFNRCSILSAEQAFRNASADGGLPTTQAPFAWFEVVR
ncbi:MAG: pilus assembly PilX N-terminal domain-containing protein [Gemmatimonadota bacterium]